MQYRAQDYTGNGSLPPPLPSGSDGALPFQAPLGRSPFGGSFAQASKSGAPTVVPGQVPPFLQTPMGLPGPFVAHMQVAQLQGMVQGMQAVGEDPSRRLRRAVNGYIAENKSLILLCFLG